MSQHLVGIASSPGIAIATAICLREIPVACLTAADQSQSLLELTQFETALDETLVALRSMRNKVAADVGKQEAEIFRAHATIAQDPALTGKVRRLIADDRLTALGALQFVRNEYEDIFADVNDDYLRERLVDVRDVLETIAQNLKPVDDTEEMPETPAVLVTHELLPSDVLTLNETNTIAVVTEGGGPTSHAAILARCYGVPAVTGVHDAMSAINNGDTVIVDGTHGKVIVDPDDETLRAYRKLAREFTKLKTSLVADTTGLIKTKDGVEIELLANVSSANDASEAAAAGASGIGLYRTEFFYLTHTKIPSEEEQVDEYRRVLDRAPMGPVTIRTLDLGGDKTIPFLAHAPESNPFMGWRSIRLSFEHPDILNQQMRAILRVAYGAKQQVRMLFPLVTTYDEFVQLKAMLDAAKKSLVLEGLNYADVQVGPMIEVPAAAIMIRDLLEISDFVAIGSNDLMQYVAAADRDNPKVSHLCHPCNPALLRMLRDVICAANAAGKPVSICGEMAGSVRSFPLLLAMGLRKFSMSPSFLPVIADLAAHVTADGCEALLQHVWRCKSADEITRLSDRFIAQTRPELQSYLMSSLAS